MVDWKCLAHSLIWRRLPRQLRRTSLFRTAAWLAPRPDPETRGGQPILVAGFLRTASGLGEGARLCYSALSECGVDVRGIDLSGSLGQVDAGVDFTFENGKAVYGPGTLLLHINSPLLPLALLKLGKQLVQQKKIIGYWAWELPKAPVEWRLGIPFVHEIWVPSRFTAEAISPVSAGRPIRILPHPVAVRRTIVAKCVGATPVFTALNIFNMASGLHRKNPFAAIHAFRKAFGDDPSARLLIHVSNANHYREGERQLVDEVSGAANIAVTSGILGAAELDGLYRSADVLISLHRSEGFGLHLAEAMLRGIPIVATNWSGNVDFMNSKNSAPVAYKLVPAVDPQGNYDHPDLVWAEADVPDAAAKLRMLRENAGLRARIGQRAAKDALQLFSAQAYLAKLNQSLANKSD